MPPGAAPPPAAQPGRNELIARAAGLCGQALDAARAASPPAQELLWLAEQLSDTNRMLGGLDRTGHVAVTAYERGRADERAARPARLRPA